MSAAEVIATVTEPVRPRRWFACSAAFAASFFAAVVVIALTISIVPAHPLEGPPFLLGDLSDLWRIFARNFLVLALYAMVGVAIIVLRRAREDRIGSGGARVLFAGRVLLTAVVAAAALHQAYVLGRMLAEFSAYIGQSPVRMGAALLPHATIELCAMFLPLAAVLSERHRSEATMRRALALAVALAIPLLLAAAATEVYVSPHVMRAVTCPSSATGTAAATCTIRP